MRKTNRKVRDNKGNKLHIVSDLFNPSFEYVGNNEWHLIVRCHHSSGKSAKFYLDKWEKCKAIS